MAGSFNRWRRRSIQGLAAGLVVAAAGSAHATWSIILIDTRTREIAVGSATCLTSFDLQAGTPVILTGIGAATAQSFVDSTGQNRVFVRDKLALSVAPADILTGLATFDTGHQTRQYGIADVLGRTATFSGTGANAWAGGQTGQFNNVHLGHTGSVVYAIQGNILTGPCVVDAAVQAAINEPGDLPQKLMKAMQAARVAGGDGRCSCPANPTSCGCPPASFTKSAHIAYMLIARTGDTDGYFGIYRSGSGPWALAVRDLTGDGRPDLISSNNASANISVLPNITPAGNPFGMFALPANYPAGASARSLSLADMTGDGLFDAVTANFGANTVSILPGQAGGTFGPKTDFLSAAAPAGMAVADFDGISGPDVAVTNSSIDLVTVLRNNGSGGLITPVQSPVGDDPRDIVALRIDGNGTLDLAVAARGQSKISTLLGNGDGTFAPGADILTALSPTFLATGDFDGDTDADLAVASQTGTGVLGVLLNNAGVFSLTQHILPAQPLGIGLGDVTGDGRPDLVVALGTQRFQVYAGSATGVFTPGTAFLTGQNLADVDFGDFDQDGDLDVAFANQTASIVIADNQGGGTFSDGPGTGSGDYFMTFNVPNQAAGNPDPVAQLQTTFDSWRGALVGRPDAVTTLVSAPVSLTTGGAGTVQITLRDWQGQPMTTPIQSVAAAHAPGSAGSCTIGPVQNQGNGVYSFQITGGAVLGTDRFRITVDDGQRPVVLMPDPAVTVLGSCYPDCNQSGNLTIADFGCFRAAYSTGHPYADCNQSGSLTINDFGCFQMKFVQGCP